MEQVSENNVKKLLNDVSNKINEFEKEWQKTGEKFNIFKITRIETDERKACRVIAALFNPRSYHGMDSQYLDLFIKRIQQKYKNFYTGKIESKTVKVSIDYPTNEGRFIDIVIEDGNIFIPFEVKINAGDQPNQVADYAVYSRKRNNNDCFPILYITKNGDIPSEKSTKNEADYKCLSFIDDIISWLEDCINQTEENLPVKDLIRQFINSIKSFCGKTEDKEMEKAIAELIIESEKSIQAAVDISNTLKEFNNELKKTFKSNILDVVKARLPLKEVWEFPDDEWHGIGIKILKNMYSLYINYNWKWININREDKPDPIIEEKIIKEMTKITHLENERWDTVVWANKKAHYPSIENVNDTYYDYEFYRQCAKYPQKVVDEIIKIVDTLESLKD